MSKLSKSESESVGNWEEVVTLYTKFFCYTSRLGLLPYQFNANTMEITSIESGLLFYLFIFNLIFFCIQTSKVCLLLILNYWTNFEFEEIRGGYIIQLTWLIGCLMVFAMMYCYLWDRKNFASTLTSYIRFEQDFTEGKKLKSYKI